MSSVSYKYKQYFVDKLEHYRGILTKYSSKFAIVIDLSHSRVLLSIGICYNRNTSKAAEAPKVGLPACTDHVAHGTGGRTRTLYLKPSKAALYPDELHRRTLATIGRLDLLNRTPFAM